jgi:hypothetical protein
MTLEGLVQRNKVFLVQDLFRAVGGQDLSGKGCPLDWINYCTKLKYCAFSAVRTVHQLKYNTCTFVAIIMKNLNGVSFYEMKQNKNLQ